MKNLLLGILLIGISASAQNNIKGLIKDKHLNQSIPGVNIYILELDKGNVSDVDGNFVIENIPQSRLTIQFSYIGYQTVYLTIDGGNINDHYTIELEPQVVRHEEVVVSAGFSDTQHKIATKVDFMDSKELQAYPEASVNAILSNIPGVDVAGGSAAVSQPVIRGLSGTNILVLNNGIRLENYQFSRNHPFNIDQYGLERIEVIKGPASLLYGSDAVGGVINLIRELPAPVNTFQADAHLRYFTNTRGTNSSIGVKQSSKQFQWGIRGSIMAHHDYKDGNDNTVSNSRYQTKSIKTFAGLNFKNGHSKIYYDYKTDLIGMTVPAVLNENLSNSTKPTQWYQDLNNHNITSKNTLLLGEVKLEGNFGVQLNNRKEIESPDIHDAGIAINSQLQTYTYELKLHKDVTDKVNSIYGIQGMYRNNKNKEAEGKIIPDAKMNDISAFTLLQYTANEHFNIQGGIRYDYRHIDVPLQERGEHHHGEEHEEETEEEHEEHEEQIELERSFQNISASLGATYEINHSILLRANVATAFRAPNLAELTQAGLHAGRHEEGNPDLVAQQSIEADFGLHTHSNLLTFDISSFYNYIDNYIYLSPTGEVEDGLPVYQYQQNGAYLTGLESGIHFHPEKAQWLHIKGTGAWIYAKQKNNTYLPFIPPIRGKVELSAKTPKIKPFDNSYVNINTEMSSDQNKPAEFETRTPGYYTLNAGIGASINKGKYQFDWSISANNLLNRVYVDHLNLLKPIGMYNMGRNISVSLNIKL
ncbi:TonB-dependent receptor [Carboxylicivirga sp. N1Y90]|uniref:TonB-dependent receptor n=1 Tax=Carboxylicivirga fragile TaxID=3417571 RepID=UPI003D324E4C|nr:TonB-dependent receptor [Marinilabiliaceae bacterium N1Y90]